MAGNLIIFIDGLQYDEGVKNLSFLKYSNKVPMRPSIGFSNNIYPEMFCGLNPDEVGYFNEWAPNWSFDKNTERPFLSMLDAFRSFNYVNAVIRILILRKIFNIKTGNIPFKYLHYFRPSGAHDFSSFLDESVLGDFNFKIIDAALYPRHRRKINSRDVLAIDEYHNTEITKGNIFLSLMELDNISHTYGIHSKQYNGHIEYLNNQLANIISSFISKNPAAGVFLLSDHGMAPVNKFINISLENEFGDMRPDKYMYFLDSTFLRVWVKDPVMMSRIIEYLKEHDGGEIISGTERAEYGVTNKTFGDILYRAKEGVMFTPNFFGIRKVKGMHGYNSNLRSQSAIFADISNIKKTQKLPEKSKEVYRYLSNVLN